MKDWLAKRPRVDSKPIPVRIIGYTDLFKPTRPSYDAQGMCQSSGIPKNSSRCLGLTRASLIQKSFSEGVAGLMGSTWTYNATYGDDCFMRDMNRELGGTLFTTLGVEDLVRKFIFEFHMEDTPCDDRARFDSSIQEKLNAQKGEYRTAFAPFRSVVLIIGK
jgi:hypothetical protein